MDKCEKTTLPKSTRMLIKLLPELYPLEELKTLCLSGNKEQVDRYLGKLELIDELLDLIKEEEEEAALEKVLAS